MGLLLGFSFVSGFEVVYFFTIRALFEHLGRGRTNAHIRTNIQATRNQNEIKKKLKSDNEVVDKWQR